MICCICDKEFDEIEEIEIGHMRFISKGGHNPSPVKEEGRCCSNCNFNTVLPARENLIRKRLKEKGNE
jgi:hypothetical protein